MRARFDVLINPALYEAIQRLPAATRQRFRRVVGRLAAGLWDGGTRVKKLRGVAKPVFEARQDDGDRILFTIAHSATRSPSGGLRPHLQLWDLVRHDDVSGRAERINRSAEAEFLGFHEVEAESVTEAPPHPAAAFDEIPTLDGTREPGVVELMLHAGPDGPTPREEIVGGVRWYVLPEGMLIDEAPWQELIDRGTAELELKLTAEQYAVVRSPGPILLSGSAGSGKTTIAVHRLAAACETPGCGRILYLTYSQWLLDHARRLFGDLLACRGHASSVRPEFLTVDELYRSVFGAARRSAPGEIAGFEEFRGWHARALRDGDPVLAWEEIRSIVKGANLDTGRPLLTWDEYETLGRKRAPLFAAARGRLYRVARQWQEHLESRGALDEIDLCRQALASLPAEGGYDHVICDEAQDLAEIQVEFLLQLLRDGSFAGLFLAGDPQQVINPSGFRWAEVRSRIRARFLDRRRPVPDIRSLNRNFRSVRGLVELANEVLAWKRDRTGRSDGDEAEESRVAGAAPILVAAQESGLVEAIRGFGPRCAVIAGSSELRGRLQRELDTTRIFTIAEAKGLEFDVVVLWGLVAADPSPWSRLLDESLDLREDPASRRALHHLYVAITRARRHLAIHEPPDAPAVWALARFATKLDSEVPASLARLFVRTASPAEWMREAAYFGERGRFRQAAECYRRAGDARNEAEALARHHEAVGEHALAAAHWAELGDSTRAARSFELVGDHAAAALHWERAGDFERARRAACAALEIGRRWGEAAEAWEALGGLDHAARCWSNAGQRARQARCLAVVAEQAGRFTDVARLREELLDWDQAAVAWRRAGEPARAMAVEARGYESDRRWDDAASAWAASGDALRALRCRAEAARAAGRWGEAAGHFEALGLHDDAVRAWKRAGNTEQARNALARRDLSEGRFVRAAEAFEELSDYARAAEAWAQAHKAGQQPVSAKALPLPAAAQVPWAPGEKSAKLLRTEARTPRRHRTQPLRASQARRERVPDARTRRLACRVRAAEDTGSFDEAAAVWKALGDPGQELRCRVTELECAGRDADLAALLEKKGRLDRAAECWVRAGQPDRALGCQALAAEKRGDLEGAAALWERAGQPNGAAHMRAIARYREQDYDAAAGLFEAAGRTHDSVVARILAAKLRMDYEEAAGALDRAGMTHLRARLLGPREQWLAEARSMREDRERHRARHLRRSQRALFPKERPSAPDAERVPAPTGDQATRAILENVQRYPGLTCEQIARLDGRPTDEIKPRTRALVEAGMLRKVGRARGTRYFPARQGIMPERA